jgi:large repetitive protein
VITWSHRHRALALGCLVSLCACGYDDSPLDPALTGEGDDATTTPAPSPPTSPAPSTPTPTYPSALTVVTTQLPDGALLEPYSAQLTASGGTLPYAWSVVAGMLPPGLSLDLATGEIFGAPTSAGTFHFTVKVTDASPSPLSASRALSIAVSAAFPLAPTALSGGATGVTRESH